MVQTILLNWLYLSSLPMTYQPDIQATKVLNPNLYSFFARIILIHSYNLHQSQARTKISNFIIILITSLKPRHLYLQRHSYHYPDVSYYSLGSCPNSVFLIGFRFNTVYTTHAALLLLLVLLALNIIVLLRLSI